MADLAHLRIAVDSRDVRGATVDLNTLSSAAGRAEGATGGLAKAAGGLSSILKSVGFGFLAAEAIRMADSMTSMTSKVRLVTSGLEELEVVQQRLFDIANGTRSGLEATTELYARMARSADALGASQADVLRVTEAINKATVVSGATASEAQAGIIQLAQGFASGTLRGDELNSVLEQMPRVAAMIADGMGITVGQLRKFGAEGKLTSKEVFDSILKMAGTVDAEFAKMPKTVGQSLTELRNYALKFIGDLDEATGITSNLSAAISALAANLDKVAAILAVVAVRFAAVRAAMAAQAITTYISQVIALEMALGATSKRAAIFSAALKGVQRSFLALTATMAVNPFVAIATAVAGLIALAYSYRNEQFKLGEDTVTIGNIVRGVWESIKNAFAIASKFMGDIWDVFTGKVKGGWNSIAGFAGNVLSAVFTALKTYVNKYIGVFVGFWRGVQAIFTDESIASAFASGLNENYVGNFADTVKGLLVDLNDLGAAAQKSGGSVNLMTRGTAQFVADAGKGKADVKERNDELERLKQVLAGAQEELLAFNETSEQTRYRKLTEEAKLAAKYNSELADELLRVRDALDLSSMWAKFEDEIKQRKEAQKEIEQYNKELQHEINLIGLSAPEREAAILQFEEEAIVAEYAARGIMRGNEALEEYLRLRRKLAADKSAFDEEAAAVQKLANNLEAAAGMLGNGRLGSVLQNVLRLEITMKDGETRKISEAIAKEFPELAKLFGEALAGAQIGQQVDGFMKALGVKSSNAGAQIGGAIGGAFFGPLGAIGGSIVGGLIGGMMKSTPRASATIETIAGEAVVAGVRGNKGQLKTMAEGLAGSMIKGLQAIADEFSGTIASGIKISIGVRNDTFRVDPLGLGRTKGMPEFKTEEEAIAYAIKLALEQGAIQGIRESTQTLLKAGDDLQAALQDAVDFEGVFDRLLEKTDPLAFGLKELEKEFERLNKIFEKAGATTEEFAELQRLYDLERADILEEERQRQMEEANKINDLILRLYREQGKEAEELALARRMESEAASDAERAILAQIYALEDFNKARLAEVATLEDTITTMSQLASSLREFRAGLFGADQGVTNYKQALVDLIRVGSLAATGDVEALGQLQGVSQSFLAASRARAGSLLDYQRDMALVASYVDQGITAADEQVSAAEQQIDLLQRQLEELVNIGELLSQPTAPDVSLAPSWNANIAGGGGGNTATLPVDSSDMQAMLRDALYAIAKNTGATAQLLDRWDGDGQPDIREYAGDYY